MKIQTYILIAIVCGVSGVPLLRSEGGDIVIESFASPSHTWKQQNDPVMGGKSTGTFKIENGNGVFDGSVVDVPFLKAPGFIKVSTSDSAAFPDISSCSALKLTVKAQSAYAGYRASIGNDKPPGGKFFAYGYKSQFDAPVGEFGDVVIPFSDFSDSWNDGTGDIINPCKDGNIYCPSLATLQNMKTISVWAEGVAGDVHLEIKQIAATGCAAVFTARAEPVLAAAAAAGDVVLEDFAAPRFSWKQQNDPVMGGESTGTFTETGGVGVFDGSVVDVPSLKAPGFIRVSTTNWFPDFADVSQCTGLKLTVRSPKPFAGYRFSFGSAHDSRSGFFARGYKAPAFTAPADFGEVLLPFASFSDYWNDATGAITVACADDQTVCPTAAALKNLKSMCFWAEGVAGQPHLEIRTVAAYGCPAQALRADTGRVVLEAFAAPTHTWKQQNDPVMGGESTGTFTVAGGVGVFQGSVVDVPSLKAPGFIKVTSTDKHLFAATYPDVSACAALTLTVKASSGYKGFRVSFGTARAPDQQIFTNGYKAPAFTAPTADFGEVTIPFNAFSDSWDAATGDIREPCGAGDAAAFCPDKKALTDLKTISVWAEGVAGDVKLEIKEIAATGCAPAKLAAKAEGNTCGGPVQAGLRYNISLTAASEDFAYPIPDGESLADAVCCEAAYNTFAEPRELYQRADVALFAKLAPEGKTTIFYDSKCGLPLFEAPKGRTLADFKADTAEHGWPSFRPEEVIAGNSKVIEATGEVVSSCGTHLGSFLPDERGARWCLDLSCLAGNPVA